MPTGPKIDIDAVSAAMTVVEDGQQQMESVTAQILASAGASTQAMSAPAGKLTAQAFDDLGGGGKALAEELNRLHSDLAALIQVAQSGADAAAAVAAS